MRLLFSDEGIVTAIQNVMQTPSTSGIGMATALFIRKTMYKKESFLTQGSGNPKNTYTLRIYAAELYQQEQAFAPNRNKR